MYPLKFLGLVLAATLFEQFQDSAAAVLSILGLAAIAGSVFTYNRQKVALTSSEAAAKAWRDERDAALSRVEREVERGKQAETGRLEAVAKATALEARPDLTSLEGAISHLIEVTSGHETMAEARTVRVVKAIESLKL